MTTTTTSTATTATKTVPAAGGRARGTEDTVQEGRNHFEACAVLVRCGESGPRQDADPRASAIMCRVQTGLPFLAQERDGLAAA